MSNEVQKIVDDFLHFYGANKHKRELSKLTDVILSHALSARGFNNFRNQGESGELFFINEILAKSNPKLCINIGANNGGYSLTLLKSTKTQVIAFEPLPTAFEVLKKNFHGFSNRIKLENLGVGAKKNN